MVGIDADVVELEVEGKGADGHVLEFVLVEVGPAPQAGVDDVREAFAAGYRGECLK